jgi:gluconokinase
MSAGFGWSRCLRFAILTSHSSKSMLPYAADGRPGWRQPVPGGSDRFLKHVGAGARDESTVAASVATSGAMRVLVDGIPEEIPSSLWCYRIDRSRSLLGRAVNDVGRVVNWLESRCDCRLWMAAT